MDRNEQKKLEADRNGKKRTETNRNRQKQTKAERNRLKQTHLYLKKKNYFKYISQNLKPIFIPVFFT